MSKTIVHRGIVQAIGNDSMKVRLVESSTCASCEASAHCHLSERKEKIVEVFHEQPLSDTNAKALTYKVGDEVKVCASSTAGWNAVILAFVFPFVVLVGGVLIARLFTTDEALMAIAGLLALIPYYLLLYLLREKVRRRFTFSLAPSD